MSALALFSIAWACVFAGADAPVRVSAARVDGDGFVTHDVQSPFQAGTTTIRVLLPDELDDQGRCTVIYVLPVEAGARPRYGDGLREARSRDLHNRHGVIFVAPTFSHLPWYADHPTDPAIRQEAYLLKIVLPAMERNYPVSRKRDGRLLVGFSKSGWGAWSLLLRHGDAFGRAAAWDAPLMMDHAGPYGSGPIFGTQVNFRHYQVTSLLKHRASEITAGRLILLGYGGFREQLEQTHALLESLHVPHVYRDGPKRKHDWHSGWMSEAVELLLAD